MWKQILKKDAAILFTKLAGSSLALTLFYNESERYRMAGKIWWGSMNSQPRPGIDPRWCSFNVEAIRSAAKRNQCFVGLVGMKSTGKSSTLDLLAREERNVMKLHMTHSKDVSDLIYEGLRKSIWTLPWFADSIRLSKFDNGDVVRHVCSIVKAWTGEPVFCVIDINMDQKSRPTSVNIDVKAPSVKQIVTDPVGALNPASINRQAVDADKFVRQIKALVADSGDVMRCVFAASEGLFFQSQSQREPRLKIFFAAELPHQQACDYLFAVHKVPKTPELTEDLFHLPRTFANLGDYAAALDKTSFVNSKLEALTVAVESSRLHCKDAATLYKRAVAGPITPAEITKLCECNLDAFRENFIYPNIFSVTEVGKYVLQFDATREVAKRQK